ncbi:hypothetical protein ACQKM9_20535 [Viridibacillus sp. NPDC093762]|uniref:hypothetical protein n=1 Tax=Viridibacillus sp. NPDC093762 TaxID=3390720 RepID=UPI003D06E4D2
MLLEKIINSSSTNGCVDPRRINAFYVELIVLRGRLVEEEDQIKKSNYKNISFVKSNKVSDLLDLIVTGENLLSNSC